ncbi:MAG: glycosyltransferase family 2 protein [Ilumatobacteraceae bacterium]
MWTSTIGFGIPFFANRDYLRETLGSLLQQSDEDWTAVVIDDCSPEAGAAEIVAEIDDPRLRYVRNHHNLGIAANFDRCLAAPGTGIVAVLHADDILEPGYVAAVRAAHADRPDAAVFAPMVTVIGASGDPASTVADRHKLRLWPRDQRIDLSGDRGLARLMSGFFLYFPAFSYRITLLPRPAFDARWTQVMDVDLVARLLLDGGTILVDRTPLYRYRRHEGTMTAQNTKVFTRLREETDIAYEVMNAARAQGWTHTARAARLHWSQRAGGLLAVASSLGRPAPGRTGALHDLVSIR